VYPDMERGFRVPGVPVVPVLGIIANVGLIFNLPWKGVGTGIGLTLALVGVYVAWGGGREIDELVQRVRTPESPESPTEPETPVGEDTGQFRVLVPVARPTNAPTYVRLAELFAAGHEQTPVIQVVTVTEIPEQTPHEVMAEVANERAETIEAALADEELSVEYSVEGHTCRDVAFDIIHSAREDGADLILMGYPEENEEITRTVEYSAPCDVMFASGVDDPDIEQINLGSGGGPHHMAAARFVRTLGEQGVGVSVVSVDPAGEGTPEDPAETVSALSGVPDLHVYNVSAASIAEGLVTKASEQGGVLMIGASRDRRLRQWVFGSTPDSVIDRAQIEGVPVLIYASSPSIPDRIEDYLFPVYRYFSKRRGSPRQQSDQSAVEN
jgi:APA family basic amino acid/polyamine antiporter